MSFSASFLCTRPVFETGVSFFLPPHGEPDFLWADMDQLVRAVSTNGPSSDMLHHLQAVNDPRRKTTTIAHEGRIVTIAPTPVTQGFCVFVDIVNGHADLTGDLWLSGPASMAFAKALADAHADHFPLSLETLTAATFNQGGPFCRGSE